MEGAHYDDWGVAPEPNPPPASMHTEAARGNLSAVRQLVQSQSPARRKKLLETMDEFGDTPIVKACRRGHTEVASYLLEQGANIDARNEDGYTPLMLACYWEQLEVVDLLLRHGADAGLTSNNGRTCYDTARTDEVRALLACGSAPSGASPSSPRKASPLPYADVRSPFMSEAAEAGREPVASLSMLAPEIRPAFGDITARLDRTFDGVSNHARRMSSAGSSGPTARSRPSAAAAVPPRSSIFRPSDFKLPEFRTSIGPSREKATAHINVESHDQLDRGWPPAVAALVSELLSQLGPPAACDDAWLSELRESYTLLQQGQIQTREYDTRKAATLGRLKYLKPTPAQASERAATRRKVESLPLLLPEPPASVPSPLWTRLRVLSKAARRAVAHDFLARWRAFAVTAAQQRALARMLLGWREAASWCLATERLLARSIARRGNRTRQLMAESFIRWADKGATRRRAADAELLDVLAHLRSENAALRSKLARKKAVESGNETEAAAAVAELEAMVADAQGLTPVLQEQVDLLKQALVAEKERSQQAESSVAQSETLLRETVAKYEDKIRRTLTSKTTAEAEDTNVPTGEDFDAINASFREGVHHAQEEAQEALLAAREMSGALVKSEDELREEILRRERAEALAAETIAQKDNEVRHLTDKLSDAHSLRRTCENLQRKLQNMEDDHRIAMETASRLHAEKEDELRTEAEAATKRTELKVATTASEQALLQQRVRELQSELNEANNRAALTEQVLLRSAAAEAAEVGADIEGVTENVKLLLRNTGDATEPQRKMIAAKKAAAIAPTKQVRRLESQVQELEKQLGSVETARQLLAEEASSAKTTCTQLRGALKSCHDTVTKEQKRAAAAARAHAEERSRLQKEIMDLTKARDSLKVQLDQAASRQASLARRAKLADEETARAKRSVERVSSAGEKSSTARGDNASREATRDSVRVLASDSLRREAEHKLATQTLQLRAIERDCEELSIQLASKMARLSACEVELRDAKQAATVADGARQAAEELIEERTAEAAALRRQLSAIPASDVYVPIETENMQEKERQDEEEDVTDYMSKDPLLRALRRPHAAPTDTGTQPPVVDSEGSKGGRAHGDEDGGTAPLGLIERLQKARSALQPSQGPPRALSQQGREHLSVADTIEKENYKPHAATAAADAEPAAPGSKIPAPSPRLPVSPPAHKQFKLKADGASGRSSPSRIPISRQKKGNLVGLRDFTDSSSEEEKYDSDEPDSGNERCQASATYENHNADRRSSVGNTPGADRTVSDSSLTDYIQSDNRPDRSPSPSFLDGEMFSPEGESHQLRSTRGRTRSSTGSSFASESFVSAQEMQTHSSSEASPCSAQKGVPFSAPQREADSGGKTANDSIGNVSFRSNTTFAPEGDCELDVTFKEPGSLGIVFGKFGNHNTVLIKELTPGCQASYETRLKPGMKLKQVDGHSIAGLSFHQALELVKAAPRPVTLSFVDTELPTIGDTLGMSPTTSGTGPASNSLTSTTDLMSDESSAIYSTDASQMSNLGESGYTTDGDLTRPDDEEQWGEKALGWLQDTAKAVAPTVAAGVGVGIAAWSEQL